MSSSARGVVMSEDRKWMITLRQNQPLADTAFAVNMNIAITVPGFDVSANLGRLLLAPLIWLGEPSISQRSDYPVLLARSLVNSELQCL